SVLVTTGDGFANTRAAYDDFHPGRDFSNAQLAPLTLTLNAFHASYQPNGEPKAYDAQVTYRAAPNAAPRHADIRVNSPLGIDGLQVYLTGHGYAPRIVIRDARGSVAFDGFVKFLP